MAAHTRTTTRRAVRCTKHAFAPSARIRPRSDTAGDVTLPGHGHIRAHARNEHASGTSGANDNPVNEADPLGLWGWNPISDITQAASDVGHAVQHHWRGIVTGVGIVAGVAAAATGVGALADVTILGVEASTLGAASATASFVAGGADLPACIAGSNAACAGAAAGFLGGGLGAAGSWLGATNDLLEEAGASLSTWRNLAPGLLGSQAFAGGVGSLSWDLLNGFPEGLSRSCG